MTISHVIYLEFARLIVSWQWVTEVVWTPRRGQTKAKQIKYYLKIQKIDQKTDTLCCCY